MASCEFAAETHHGRGAGHSGLLETDFSFHGGEPNIESLFGNFREPVHCRKQTEPTEVSYPGYPLVRMV